MRWRKCRCRVSSYCVHCERLAVVATGRVVYVGLHCDQEVFLDQCLAPKPVSQLKRVRLRGYDRSRSLVSVMQCVEDDSRNLLAVSGHRTDLLRAFVRLVEQYLGLMLLVEYEPEMHILAGKLHPVKGLSGIASCAASAVPLLAATRTTIAPTAARAGFNQAP